MKRRLGVLLSALVAAAPAVAADLESLTDDEIRRVMESGDLEAFEALIGERPPPAPPATEEEFERAFRVKQPERMGWARAALEDPKPGTPFVGAVNGLAREGTPEARALLREFVPRFELLDRRRRWIMKAWAYAFAQEYGEATAREARRGVEDLALPALDRALHLMAFRLVDREEALRFYRPYLRDPEPEVRYAALQVNSKHWDSEVTETLIELEDGTDPLVRETARWLSKRYLRWGDARPEPGGWGTMSPQFRRAHPTPADPEGWKAHGARAAEWRRQQYILVHGEEPPPPPPPPRSPEELRLRVVDPERGSLFEER